MHRTPRKSYPIDKARWEKFGAWIKIWRKKYNLTQSDLAGLTKLSRIQIHRIENGKSATSKAKVLALGRLIGADDVTTLKMAGFENAVTINVPKEIGDLLREHGNKLSDQDFVSIAAFVTKKAKNNMGIK